MNIAQARNLTVRYGGYTALEDVGFSLESGDFAAIVGPNGSGKSTLVKALLGLVRPASGTVTVFGLPPGEATRRHPVGYLPQQASFAEASFPATVREVVASGLPYRDMAAVEEAMVLLRVDSLASARVGTLSGGQQQRTHLARALARKPEFLILDEPTGALDPESRECFYSTLNELNEGGVAILIVSHDLDAVSRRAGKVLLLDRRALYWGDVEGFRNREPGHYFADGSAYLHSHGHGRCADQGEAG